MFNRIISKTKFNLITRRGLYTKTTLHPNEINFSQPNDNHHKSLILLTTPTRLNDVVNKVIEISKGEKNSINQILVACVDTILNSRDGYSEMWLRDNFKIDKYETIEQMNQRTKKKIDPLSVDPIKFDKSWKDKKNETLFEINFHNKKIINSKIRLSNTLFNNGENCTCFYIGNEDLDWYNLSSVSISINDEIVENGEKYSNRLTEIPMVEDNVDENEIFQITDFEGNLIKSINNQSASGFLINNSIVMESKKDLYFKLYDDGEKSFQNPSDEKYYKLIVGGLGWGEKQAFLAIDPIVGSTGYKNVKLYYYDSKTIKQDIGSPENEDGNNLNKIVFECSEIQQGYSDIDGTDTKKAIVKEHIFGMGCEDGFELNNVWHRSNGETIELCVSCK